jgi:hypothetical protein
MIKKIKNKKIYIAPFNNLSPIIKNYLDTQNFNTNFCGYIDKSKTSTKITEDNSIVIISSPNYYKEIKYELIEQYKDLNIIFIYAFINKGQIQFIDNYLFYRIIQSRISLFNYLSNLFIKKINVKYKILQKKLIFDKHLFLPQPLLKVEANIEKILEPLFLQYSIKNYPDWFINNKNIHSNKRCFILATGPSLNKLNLSKLKNEYTIGVNGIYKVANNINLNYYIYVSNWYWKNHISGIKNLNCDRKFLPIDLKPYLSSEHPTSWINIARPKYYSKLGYPLTVPSNFSKNPHKFFNAGGTVIFLALQLAYFLGFKEVILLGLDHSYKKDDFKNKTHGGYYYDTTGGDKSHFDSEYTPDGIDVHVDLEAMENGYKMAKELFEKENKQLYNASPGTKLDIFKKIDYEKLF